MHYPPRLSDAARKPSTATMAGNLGCQRTAAEPKVDAQLYMQTVRQTFVTCAKGGQIRLRVSNAFGGRAAAYRRGVDRAVGGHQCYRSRHILGYRKPQCARALR